MSKAGNIAIKAVAALLVAMFAYAAFVASRSEGDVASSSPGRRVEGSKPIEPIRVLFVGDMMFDRTIRKIAEREGYGYPLSCVADYLDGFDLIVGNLEGPVTGYPSKSRDTVPGDPDNTTFTFSPQAVLALAESGPWMAHLGNNHIHDFGREGARSSVSYLTEAGIPSFGAPGGQIAATTTVNGVRLALVSFNQFLGQGDPERTASAVRALRPSSDFVAVYAHWGDEYVPEGELQKAYARAFIEAGADAVIGSHPHVIQSAGDYLGGRIYYSLGNFVFDQYWNDDVSTGLGVEATIRPGDIAFDEAVFELRRDGTTCLKYSVDKRG